MREASTIIIGTSKMARLIRRYDWTSSGLGLIEDWPQSLVTSVNIVLQSPVPLVMLWGSDGIMIYNDSYSTFAGKRHPKLLGSKVIEGWPEVADFNRNVMASVRGHGETLIYEDQQLTLFRNNIAEEVWMDLTYSPIIDESGKPNGVLAIVLETTQRVLAEKRQRDAESDRLHERERLYSLFMDAPAPIAILRGPEHRFELTNPLYLQLIGRDSVMGKTVAEALPEVIEQGFVKILDKVYKSGKPYFGNEVAVSLDHDDGSIVTRYLNFVYQPSFDSQHAVDGIMVYAVDVTDQVVARRAVEEIASVNKSITDNATTGLLIMDQEHYVTHMNPAAQAITGYTLDDIQHNGKTLHDTLHPQRPDGSPYPIEECPTSQALVTQKRVIAEDVFFRPDGRPYEVLIMSSPIVQEGELVGIVEEIRDISSEKAAEEEIRQLNRELETRVSDRTRELTAANKELNRSNEELQDFAYVASHDLQEPLRKIAAFSNMLEADYREILPAEAHMYLESLQKSSTRMRTLINDLLTYSRVTTQARPFRRLDLSHMVNEALEDLGSRIDETKATITVGKLCTIDGDELQIRLLLQNLLSNALKYIKPGVAPKISVTSISKNNNCTISITDNGIGFDERYNDRIFTIFQRLHGRSEYEGTGVGLAICKKIAERHGGSITAKSTIGKGSTFVVTIPMKQVVPHEN